MLLTAGAALLAAAGCGPKVTKRACMGGAADNPLVADAAMVRLDVYGAEAHCADGATLATGAGAPILSHSYTQGQAISLDVPPGPHALVLSTFADADGTQLLGIGCTEANLSAGSQICFDLTIEPGPDGGADDLSASIPCTTTPNSCPSGQYCDGSVCRPGCGSDTDCSATADGGVGSAVCDTTTHQCVRCYNDVQCGGGLLCCNNRCVNPNTDTANCGACERSCSTANVVTATCAGGVCTSTCVAGFGNCTRPVAPTADDGCETDTNGNVDDCGACGRTCSATNVVMRSCASGVCNSTCTAGFGNCSTPAAPKADDGCETNTTNDVQHCGSCSNVCTQPANETASCVASMCGGGACNAGFSNCNGSAGDGCECKTDPASPACCGSGCQTVHNNGWGGNYFDCSPLGTPSMAPTTYSSTMGNEAAFSYTAQAGTPSGGWFCGSTINGGTACNPSGDCTLSICKPSISGNKGACTCWVWDATGAYVDRIGHTYHSSGQGSDTGCLCPFATDPSWN